MAPNATVTPLRTRRPTGKPPWPIILVAGARKAGKSYTCAEASGSPNIDRTFWISLGEDDPDEYGPNPETGEGGVPGADFEIVEHDGTYKSILAALAAAKSQPAAPGKVNLIILDSGGRVWELLSDMAQATANRRAAAKAARYNRPVSDEDASVGFDLWNVAKDKWQAIVDVLREHSGPSIITATLEKTTVMNEKGEPTGQKDWKIKAEKNIGGDVGAIVELMSRGEAYISGVRSLKMDLGEDRKAYPGFTVQQLWDDMGVTAPGATSPRQHSAMLADRSEHMVLLREIATLADALGTKAQVAQEWSDQHDGQSINDATDLGGLELLRDDLAAQAEQKGAAA